MMRQALLVAAALLTSAEAARAERLTVALSTPEVTINSNFTGTTVTVFGVIDRDAASLSGVGGYQVGVLLIGPPRTVVARRKERLFGIWANAASETFEGAPSFYLFNTSAPAAEIAAPATLERLQLGFDHIGFRTPEQATPDDPTFRDFRSAFIRLKERDALYGESTGVEFIGNLIFRTTFRLPANVPVGAYTAEAYLFSDGSLIAREDEGLTVSKTGLEETMSNFARNQGLIYGLICVVLGASIGWLGGVIFRRD